jgi:hypothetical protein
MMDVTLLDGQRSSNQGRVWTAMQVGFIGQVSK